MIPLLTWNGKNDLWLYVKIGRYYGYIKFELNVDCHQYAIHMGNNIIFDDISLYKKTILNRDGYLHYILFSVIYDVFYTHSYYNFFYFNFSTIVGLFCSQKYCIYYIFNI